MVKNKVLISGKFVTPDIIEIKVDTHQQLVPGQKVLIYRTTDKNIVGATGKIIGKKERVIGSGKIEYEDGKLLVKVPQKSPISSAYRVNGRKNLGLVSRDHLLKLKHERPVKRVQRFNEVYIKPIEE